MRRDNEVLKEAKRVLWQEGTTATVKMVLRNIINNRKVIDVLRKTAEKSQWKGFSDDP